MTASAPGFDTLVHVRRLEEAGVDEARAEAVRGAIGEGVATRADGARIETRSTALKVTMLPAIAGVAVASVKLLPQGAP